jgi:hypothetical protein
MMSEWIECVLFSMLWFHGIVFSCFSLMKLLFAWLQKWFAYLWRVPWRRICNKIWAWLCYSIRVGQVLSLLSSRVGQVLSLLSSHCSCRSWVRCVFWSAEMGRDQSIRMGNPDGLSFYWYLAPDFRQSNLSTFVSLGDPLKTSLWCVHISWFLEAIWLPCIV